MNDNDNNTRPKKRNSVIIYDLSFYQFYINNAKRNKEELKFKSNEVDTRKYNFLLKLF